MADLISKIKGLDNVTYDLKDEVSTFGNENLLGNTWNSELPTISNSNAASTFGTLGLYNSPASAFSIEAYDDSSNSLILSETVTGNRGISWYTKPGIIKAGEIYTFSCMLKPDVAISAHTHTAWRNGSATAAYTGWTSQGAKNVPANAWYHYIFSFTPNAGAKLDWEFLVAICFTGQTTGVTCRIAHAKLEHSNKPTDWSPSCYDLATYDDNTITFFQ